MKIFAFAASLRKDSYNKKLLALAAESLRRSSVTVDACDFREFSMPVYDGDLEESSGLPDGAKKLIDRILAADALVISAPEYNGGISGAFKNALDWISRVDTIPIDGKAVLLMGASPGGFGAVRGLWHSRVPLEAMGAYVYPELFGIPKAHEAFQPTGQLVQLKMQERLDALLLEYLKFAKALSARTA